MKIPIEAKNRLELAACHPRVENTGIDLDLSFRSGALSREESAVPPLGKSRFLGR